MPGRFSMAPKVVCRQTNSGLRMLFNPESGVMYELNETASDVVAVLIELQPASVDGIAARLVEMYDAPPGEVREAVEELMTDFVNAEVVARV